MFRLIALAVFASSLSAAAAGGQPNEARLRDLAETMRARKLLLDDPALANLNVGVNVANHIAVLWGPVPSVEHAQRAEQRLRLMFELVTIQNRLSIEPDDNVPPLTPAPIAPPAPAAPLLDFRPEKPATALPGSPRRPAVVLGTKVERVDEPQAVTTRSSPAAAVEPRRSVHIPFMGSFAFPRTP